MFVLRGLSKDPALVPRKSPLTNRGSRAKPADQQPNPGKRTSQNQGVRPAKIPRIQTSQRLETQVQSKDKTPTRSRWDLWQKETSPQHSQPTNCGLQGPEAGIVEDSSLPKQPSGGRVGLQKGPRLPSGPSVPRDKERLLSEVRTARARPKVPPSCLQTMTMDEGGGGNQEKEIQHCRGPDRRHGLRRNEDGVRIGGQ